MFHNSYGASYNSYMDVDADFSEFGEKNFAPIRTALRQYDISKDRRKK